MKINRMPDIDVLPEIFSYEKSTGVVTRKKLGKEAGTKHSNGYVYIRVSGKSFMAHRIAWALHFGEHPKTEIDHINGNKSDNRIVNLRECIRSENQANRGVQSNSKTGFKGVSYHAHSKKFMARAVKNGKTFNLGYFDTAELAHEAYMRSAKALHGEFARGS